MECYFQSGTARYAQSKTQEKLGPYEPLNQRLSLAVIVLFPGSILLIALAMYCAAKALRIKPNS